MGILRPFTNGVIAGASCSGKSSYLKRFLLEANRVYSPSPSLIIYVYKIYDPDFDMIKRALGNKVLFLDTLPEEDQVLQLVQGQTHTLLCIDDAIDFTGNKFFVNLFVCLGHHHKITSMIVTQHLFHKAAYTGTILQNAHIIVLMPSPRDYSTILAIGRQLGEFKLLRDIYNDVLTLGPYAYLILNLDPAAPRAWRYMTSILSSDKSPLTVYIPA